MTMDFRVACLLRAGLVFALMLPAVARPQMDGLSEYQIKAVFLFNFAKFTEWSSGPPTSRDAGFVLCVAGKDPFGPALASIEGKAVHGRELRVRRGVSSEDLRGCQVLFVAESEERRVAAIVKAAQNERVLTVSDIDGFADAGGVIALVTVDNRIQFDVNLAAAGRADLRFSSQLLKLARSVSGAKRN
jgi:hypothetical protein